MVHKILKIDSIFTNHDPLIEALVPFQFNSPSIFNQTGTHFLLQNFRIIFKQENIFSLRLPNESRNEIYYFFFSYFPQKRKIMTSWNIKKMTLFACIMAWWSSPMIKLHIKWKALLIQILLKHFKRIGQVFFDYHKLHIWMSW